MDRIKLVAWAEPIKTLFGVALLILLGGQVYAIHILKEAALRQRQVCAEQLAETQAAKGELAAEVSRPKAAPGDLEKQLTGSALKPLRYAIIDSPVEREVSPEDAAYVEKNLWPALALVVSEHGELVKDAAAQRAVSARPEFKTCETYRCKLELGEALHVDRLLTIHTLRVSEPRGEWRWGSPRWTPFPSTPSRWNTPRISPATTALRRI